MGLSSFVAINLVGVTGIIGVVAFVAVIVEVINSRIGWFFGRTFVFIELARQTFNLTPCLFERYS